MDFNAYYIYKFFDKDAIDLVGQSGLNRTVYRYVDVLLMYAEAQAIADKTPNGIAVVVPSSIKRNSNKPKLKSKSRLLNKTVIAIIT